MSLLKTHPELYRVAGQKRNHLWLEIIEGEDQGIRVSVPIYASVYSDSLQKQITELTPGCVERITLVSETKNPPQWRIETIHTQEP